MIEKNSGGFWYDFWFTLLSIKSLKVSFLISVASRVFVACSLFFYLKKNEDHCLLASSLPFHSCWQTFL